MLDDRNCHCISANNPTKELGQALKKGHRELGRAVTDAKGGDAHEWLARYLIGTAEAVAPRLLEMATEAEAGIDAVEDAANVKRMFRAYETPPVEVIPARW